MGGAMSASSDTPTRPPASAGERVQAHFEANAAAFDDLYEDERLLQRLLRPGLFRRRELAREAARSYESPRVLDVGCGSGRIGELVLRDGAREWVGVDFSEPMLALARQRLQRFGERAQIIEGDFLQAALASGFDVILALGLFDYIADPAPFLARMYALCAPRGSLVASFPAWSPLKGPLRHLRYEWLRRCPIFDYTDAGLRELLAAAGFGRVELHARRSGFLAQAWR
jgi:SAM-dependent methyltransferase